MNTRRFPDKWYDWVLIVACGVVLSLCLVGFGYLIIFLCGVMP